jgi:DNA-binding response OmpR family regulator/HPt (histidine-containing phosphotransfer) domain-containing protein
MRKLLTIGLHIRHKARLHGRLKDVEFRSANDRAEALAIMESEKMDMLVVDEALEEATLFLETVKKMGIPTIFCAESQKSTAFLRSLVVDLGVSVVLVKPIDPDELVRRAGELMLATRTKEEEADPVLAEMAQRLSMMWAKFAPANRERVEWLKGKVLDLFDGEALDEAARREMEREAHKLVGALGTFGFPRASIVAREIEMHVSPTKGKPIMDAAQLLEWIQAIAREIEKEPDAPTGSQSKKHDGPMALVISEDQELIETLQKLEVNGQSLGVETAASWSRARESWFLHAPDLVLVDLCGEMQEERQTLLRALGGRLSTIPVLTLLPREIWSEPEALARFAGMPVLFHPFDQHLLSSAVSKLMNQEKRMKPRVLAVDDDPQILAAIESLLQPLKLDITTLSDSLEFWDTLEATSPDLLILDLDMPFLSGLELCRGVRSSTRWCELPILFLSASSDSETIHRLFSVGADDFVKKPFTGPELATRVVNRLVRSGGPRQDKEGDARVSSGLDVLRGVLADERSRGREVALALLRVRNEDGLREAHGNAAISVLNRQFGIRLAERLRDLGTITRWRSGEYLVALPGQTMDAAKHQLELFLKAPELRQFTVGESMTVTLQFAVGLTLVRSDEESLEAALRQCQRSVNKAEQSDALIVASEHEAVDAAREVVTCELLILEPAEKTGRAVENLMKERGFASRWDPSTEEAITALTCEPPTLETQVIFISSGGLELLKKLGPITRLVNVVVAVSTEDELAAAFDNGAFDCVEKPCKVATLVKRLERAFEF